MEITYHIIFKILFFQNYKSYFENKLIFLEYPLFIKVFEKFHLISL